MEHEEGKKMKKRDPGGEKDKEETYICRAGSRGRGYKDGRG